MADFLTVIRRPFEARMESVTEEYGLSEISPSASRRRRRSEALSRRTERRERLLSTALASMSDFAQIYDQAGRILFVNQPLLDLWGLTLEEAVGKNFSDLEYPKELAEKLNRQLQHVFETGQEVTDEASYTSPAGVVGML